MKKAFKFVYVDERKKFVFSLVAAYIILAISLTTTIADEKFKFVINILQLLLGGVIFTFVIADVVLKKTRVSVNLLLLAACSFASLIIAKNTFLLVLFVFILVLKEYKFEDIIKFLYFVLVIVLFTIILLACIKAIPNWIHTRGEINRYTLGFKTATLSQSIFMFITLIGAYLWKEKLNFEVIILEMLVAVVLYYFTNSRLGFLMSLFILLTLIVIKIFKKIPKLSNIKLNKHIVKICKFIFVISPFICLGFSLLLTFSYKFQSDFIIKLNSLLSNRLKFSYDAFQNNNLSPFGAVINWHNDVNGGYIGVDNSYLFYIFDLGIVNAIIVFALLSCLIYKVLKIKDHWLMFSLLVCLACSLIEPYLMDYKYNLFVFAFVLLFQDTDRHLLENTNKKLINKETSTMAEKVLKKVCVVVVTYNRKQLLKEAVSALLKQNYKDLQIVIIDNASTDGTKEYIQDLLADNVYYHNSGENLGGAGGFNLGMKKAVELGCDYIWVMDDDCIVHEDTLTKLIDFAKSVNDNFGFLSSKVLWTDGSMCRMNIQKNSVLKKVKDFDKNQKVRFATFVSMLIKRDVVEELGLPIKDFFIWVDDWEYSSRISNKYDCYYVADSVVTHKCANNIGANIILDNSDRIDRYRYQFRNESYLYHHNGLKIYYPLWRLRNMYKRLKIRLKKVSNKKQKVQIIKAGEKEGKHFNPRIEYVYDKNTKVNVLEFFGEPLAYGGQEAFMINMYKNFDRENVSYTFCTPFDLTNKTLIELASKRNDEIVSYNYNFNSKFRKMYIKKAIKQVLEENNKFDVIHIQSGSIFTLLNVAKIAKQAGVKRVIVHSHSTGKNNFKYKLIKHFSDKKIEKYADEFFACSKLAGEWKFPKTVIENQKLTVINNGIDTERFTFNENVRKEYRDKLGLNDEFTILNVGRFDEMKNHKFMVEIAQTLSEKGVDFKFVLIGEGDLKESIISQISAQNLQNHFIFLEKRTDIAEIMMACDVFVLPSLFEGLPIVAVEAQTTGLATLCSANITTEVKMCERCQFLELDVDAWVNQILAAKNENVDRSQYAVAVKDAGYDAKQSATILEKKYLCE